MRSFDALVQIIVLFGGLNWGLIGFFDFNPLEGIFGPVGSRVVYATIGLCALYEIIAWKPVHAHLSPRERAPKNP